MASEAALLNDQSLVEAREFNVNGTSNSNDIYAQFKAFAYDDRVVNFPVTVAGSMISFGHDLELHPTLVTDYDPSPAEGFRLRINGGTPWGPQAGNPTTFDHIRCNILTGVSNIQVQNMRLEATTEILMQTGLSFDTGVTLQTPLVSDIPSDIGGVSALDGVTIDGATTLDWSIGSDNPTILNFRNITFTSTTANSILVNTGTTTIIELDPAQDEDIFQATGAGTVLVFRQAGSVTITIPRHTGGYYWIDHESSRFPIIGTPSDPLIGIQGTRRYSGIPVAGQGDTPNPTRRLRGVQSFQPTTGFDPGVVIRMDIPDYLSTDALWIGVKYNSTLSTRQVYQEFVHERPTIGSGDTAIPILIPQPVTQVLVQQMATAVPTGVSFTTTNPLSATDERLLITVSGANTRNTALGRSELSAAQGQALAVAIGNDMDYFAEWWDRRGTWEDPIIDYLTNSGAQWDADRVFFRSGEMGNGTDASTGATIQVWIQQRIEEWASVRGATSTNQAVDSRSGFPELAFIELAEASLSRVALAATEGIEASTTATHVSETRRGMGYLVSDGTTSGSGNTRLIGLVPKSADFDNTQTYEDNL